ncbi:MAG: hypothetical protein DRQ51_04715 [Gammaproteobacteria bacterium]|nr:MAG: hypothetical protein DRQ51_04715 [Gammaproteobacteria bacterium]
MKKQTIEQEEQEKALFKAFDKVSIGYYRDQRAIKKLSFLLLLSLTTLIIVSISLIIILWLW